MKKKLLLLTISLVLLTGCNKENKDVTPNVPSTTTSTTTTTTTSTTTTTTTKATTTTKKKTTKKTTTKKTTTTKKATTSKTCQSKKFKNKYSYVYTSNDECKKQGNLNFFTESDKDSNIFSYGCEKIVDDCGKEYYGVYFYTNASGEPQKIYK